MNGLIQAISLIFNNRLQPKILEKSTNNLCHSWPFFFSKFLAPTLKFKNCLDDATLPRGHRFMFLLNFNYGPVCRFN